MKLNDVVEFWWMLAVTDDDDDGLVGTGTAFVSSKSTGRVVCSDGRTRMSISLVILGWMMKVGKANAA